MLRYEACRWSQRATPNGTRVIRSAEAKYSMVVAIMNGEMIQTWRTSKIHHAWKKVT